ncbi:Effector protein HopAB3 [Pseudomonas syringae group genomosp. 3]|nr:Effector protein HopAB3 [Pseudomonas syringae group genomosp. 3]
MVGINRAGPSGAYFGGHTDPEPVSGQAHGSSSGASSSNSPRLPAPPDAPASQARDRREMLLRARPLSRQTREWVAQGMPPTAEAGVPIRLQEPAAAAVPHARTEERHASEEPADAAAPRAHAEARRTLDTPAYARAPQHAGATAHANSIVQQLVEAGADLAHTRIMFRNILRGEEIVLSRAEHSVFLQHFPNMPVTGINRHSELAIELRGALSRADSQQAAPAPARTPPRSSARTPERSLAPPTATESSSGSNQRTLLGRFAGLMTPNQRRPSNVSSTSQRPVDRSPPRVDQRPIRVDRVAMRNRGNHQADAALQGLIQQGVNLEHLRTALERHVMRRLPIPRNIGSALQNVGINPSIDSRDSLVEHPLLNLNAALNRMQGLRPSAERAPRPAVPVVPATASRRPDGTRATPLRVMPEREDYENNVAYGVRLLSLNPGAGGSGRLLRPL